MKKTLHWLSISKWVQINLWEVLSESERRVIAADAEHVTPEYQNFVAKVELETEVRFQNPNYPMNDPNSFKHDYWNDPTQVESDFTPYAETA